MWVVLGCFLLAVVITSNGSQPVPQLSLLERKNSGLYFYEGETVKLICEVTNSTNVPQLVWRKGISPIKQSNNQVIQTTVNGTSAQSILTLRHITVGEYHRTFFHCKDQATGKASLNTDFFNVGKIAVSKSGGEYSKYGENVTLTCRLTVGRKQDVEYLMWRRAPSQIVFKKVGDTLELELTLTDLNDSDGGMYECVFKLKWLSNFFINKTNEIKVAPVSTREKQKEIIVKTPESVRLTCDVRGYPLNIVWKMNCNTNSSGEKISFQYFLKNNHRTLVFNETNSNIIGMYCCIGSNGGGVVKQVFNLTEFVTPNLRKDQLKNVTFNASSSVELKCDIQGYPLTILWKKNCDLTSKGSNIVFDHLLKDNNKTLVINKISVGMEGTFCCLGVNDGGTVKQIFFLKRFVTPNLPKAQLKNVTFNASSSVELKCDIQGYPLTILWKKNCDLTSKGSKIVFDHLLKDNNKTLVINKISVGMEGTFCCLGVNDGGTVKQIFFLKRFERRVCENVGATLTSELHVLFLLLFLTYASIHACH